MTAASGNQLNYGTRYFSFYQLDSLGNVDAIMPATAYMEGAVYPGVQIIGAINLGMNEPPPRVFQFPGDDSTVGSASLPAVEVEAGQLTASPWIFSITSLLEGTKVRTLGDMVAIGRGSGRSGPRVGILSYQASVDLDTGGQKWHTIIYPSVKLVPIGQGFAEGPQPITYQITPTKVSKHLWGETFTIEDDGFLKSVKTELDSFGKPMLFRCIGDGAETTYNFPFTARAGTTPVVYKNGVAMGNGFTATTTDIVFDTPFGAADVVLVLGEQENDEDA